MESLPGIPCSHSLFLAQAFPLEAKLGAGLYAFVFEKESRFFAFLNFKFISISFKWEFLPCQPLDLPSWPVSSELWAQEMPDQLFPASQFSLHLDWWHLLGSSPLSSDLPVFSLPVLPVLALLVLKFLLHPLFLILPSLTWLCTCSGIPDSCTQWDLFLG